jgi:hypothetical protein
MLAGSHTLEQHSTARGLLQCQDLVCSMVSSAGKTGGIDEAPSPRPLSDTHSLAPLHLARTRLLHAFTITHFRPKLLKDLAGVRWQEWRSVVRTLHPPCYLNSVERESESVSYVSVHPLLRPRLNSFTKNLAHSA